MYDVRAEEGEESSFDPIRIEAVEMVDAISANVVAAILASCLGFVVAAMYRRTLGRWWARRRELTIRGTHQWQRKRLIHAMRSSWVDDHLHSTQSLLASEASESKYLASPIEVDNEGIISQVDALVEAWDRPDGERRLWLLGHWGVGKTTHLLRLAEQLLERGERDDQEPIPIVLSLSEWRRDDRAFSQWIMDEATRAFKGISSSTLTTMLGNGEICFLLDGLDECEFPSDCAASIMRMVEQNPECQVVVTERLADSDSGASHRSDITTHGFRFATAIQPSVEQLEMSVDEVCGDCNPVRASEIKLLLRRLRELLGEVAQRPLVVALAIYVGRSSDDERLRLVRESDPSPVLSTLFDTYTNAAISRRHELTGSRSKRWNADDARTGLAWVASIADLLHLGTTFSITAVMRGYGRSRWRRRGRIAWAIQYLVVGSVGGAYVGVASALLLPVPGSSMTPSAALVCGITVLVVLSAVRPMIAAEIGPVENTIINAAAGAGLGWIAQAAIPLDGFASRAATAAAICSITLLLPGGAIRHTVKRFHTWRLYGKREPYYSPDLLSLREVLRPSLSTAETYTYRIASVVIVSLCFALAVLLIVGFGTTVLVSLSMVALFFLVALRFVYDGRYILLSIAAGLFAAVTAPSVTQFAGARGLIAQAVIGGALAARLATMGDLWEKVQDNYYFIYSTGELTTTAASAIAAVTAAAALHSSNPLESNLPAIVGLSVAGWLVSSGFYAITFAVLAGPALLVSRPRTRDMVGKLGEWLLPLAPLVLLTVLFATGVHTSDLGAFIGAGSIGLVLRITQEMAFPAADRVIYRYYNKRLANDGLVPGDSFTTFLRWCVDHRGPFLIPMPGDQVAFLHPAMREYFTHQLLLTSQRDSLVAGEIARRRAAAVAELSGVRHECQASRRLQLVERLDIEFRDDVDVEIRSIVAEALLIKVDTLDGSGKTSDAIFVCEDVVTRYGRYSIPALNEFSVAEHEDAQSAIQAVRACTSVAATGRRRVTDLAHASSGAIARRNSRNDGESCSGWRGCARCTSRFLLRDGACWATTIPTRWQRWTI